MAKKYNFYTKQKEINGTTYTAQFNGVSAALKMFDECKDANGNTNSYELYEYICENVIVEPKITPDDFDDLDTLNKVVKWAMAIAQGKFRDKNEIPAREASK